MKHKNSCKKRIAVISPKREISMFFELEATACGCPVRVFSAPPEELSEFDLVVLDLAAGYCFSQSDTCRIVAVSADGKKPDQHRFDDVWEWPISIETVREAYEGTTSVKEETVASSESNPTIYFLPEQENTVVYRNQTIALTSSECLVLKLLADRFGEPISRTEISALFEGTQGNLADVHICHLRKKLEAPFGVRLIETVRGQGYCLKANAIYLS
ncbi:MAG: winged-helix domain-containing protein [Clostridia bacterium]|nr:winged-helix domain-containing protein [Clostridia bacterium]